MAQPKYSPSKRYVVTGAYVTAKTMTTEGVRIIGLHAGAPLPNDVPESDGQHLLDHELIAESDVQPKAEPAKADDSKGSGSAPVSVTTSTSSGTGQSSRSSPGKSGG